MLFAFAAVTLCAPIDELTAARAGHGCKHKRPQTVKAPPLFCAKRLCPVCALATRDNASWHLPRQKYLYTVQIKYAANVR